jgi:polygalacturonase
LNVPTLVRHVPHPARALRAAAGRDTAPTAATPPTALAPWLLAVSILVPGWATAQEPPFPADAVHDVRSYGALGDGTTLDTDAINAAIDAAAEAGGGTVYFPAGTYPSFSIRLRSHVALYLGRGATLLAADPADYPGHGYDPAEPNVWGDDHEYQDFGHSHWHNSLIWGEGLEDVGVLGPGTVDGAGLWKGLYPPLGPAPTGQNPGNKAIALKLSRGVTLRDFTIFRGGHFGILATGVDNLTIDNIRIDTNRDGIDIDACRNVRISNVSVNSPNDDAIVLKSSFALGQARITENVTITNSLVSGYDMGTLLDGTYRRTVERAPDRDGPAGRIKFGTESNGGFRNITISNVVFDRSRGIALETVDGGVLEDVVISNVTMRDLSNGPFFLRLGARMRGPGGTPVGKLRRVTISNVVVYDADPRFAAIIAGIPGHPVEDVKLSDIQIWYRGGVTMDQVAEQPDSLINPFFAVGDDGTGAGAEGPAGRRDPYAVPEREAAYPEASMFGLLPAYGFYIRHARGIGLDNVAVHLIEDDERPTFVLEDVEGIGFVRLTVDRPGDEPIFVLQDVRDFQVVLSEPMGDIERDSVADEVF